jgi:hypothetical protein
MTRRLLTALAFMTTTAALAAAAPAGADTPQLGPSLQLPVTGTATGGATFTGTFTLRKFVNRGGHATAVGFIKGTLTSAAGVTIGSGLAGPVELPVTVSGGAASNSGVSSAAAVQVQQTCEVLHVDLGSGNVDLLGLQVATLPIGIDLTAVSEGTDVLGRLICVVLETVDNVVGLVNLLNQILGLLGGLGL